MRIRIQYQIRAEPHAPTTSLIFLVVGTCIAISGVRANHNARMQIAIRCGQGSGVQGASTSQRLGHTKHETTRTIDIAAKLIWHPINSTGRHRVAAGG